ncbi:MAG: LEA type 2 family protein [Verrucomicrobiales bacterium]|nr:LEA type 2 family protein [Verrucomicrobiales bacterium]
MSIQLWRKGTSRRAAVGILAVLTWIVAGGCATTPEEPPVEVSVTHLRFTRATVFETVGQVELRIENLSPDDLSLTGSSHKLSVNGVKIGRALSPDALTLPRLSGVGQNVECHLRNGALAKVIGELARDRGTAATYRLVSTLYVSRAGGRSKSLTVEKTGSLDLKEWMPAEAWR